MKHITEVLILVIPPVIYKLYRDRNGVSHPDRPGVLAVAMVMFICVTFTRLFEIWHHGAPYVMTVKTILWWYFKAFLVSITGYGLFFNPLINYILTRHSGWTVKYRIAQSLDRLNPDAIPDKWFLKWGVSWQVRLIGYTVLFLASLLWFIMSSSRSLESYLH